MTITNQGGGNAIMLSLSHSVPLRRWQETQLPAAKRRKLDNRCRQDDENDTSMMLVDNDGDDDCIVPVVAAADTMMDVDSDQLLQEILKEFHTPPSVGEIVQLCATRGMVLSFQDRLELKRFVASYWE